MKPHKHAELIKAWADGHKIEFYSNLDDEWLLVNNPGWFENTEYRIAPKKYFIGDKFINNDMAELYVLSTVYID